MSLNTLCAGGAGAGPQPGAAGGGLSAAGAPLLHPRPPQGLRPRGRDEEGAGRAPRPRPLHGEALHRGLGERARQSG